MVYCTVAYCTHPLSQSLPLSHYFHACALCPIFSNSNSHSNSSISLSLLSRSLSLSVSLPPSLSLSHTPTLPLSHSLQVTIHTDTLNESCCVERTLESFKGRCIHTYHTEGAGGENLNVSEFVLFRIRLHQLFALTDISMTAPFIPSFS